MASIKGIEPALEHAEKVYWMRYLSAMTSLRFFVIASGMYQLLDYASSEIYEHAQYVFRLANAARRPVAVKKLVTISKASPVFAVEQFSHCNSQPYTSEAIGMTRKKANMPLFSLS